MSKLTFLSLIASATVAVASPLNPSGLHSEATLLGAAATSGSAAVVQNTNAPSWFEQKITTVRAIVWGRQVAAAPVAPTTVVQTAAAPAVKTTVATAPENTKAAPVVNRKPSSIEEAPAEVAVTENIPGLNAKKSGVKSYDLSSSPTIPVIRLAREARVNANRYALEDHLQKVMDERVIGQFVSPPLLSTSEFKKMIVGLQTPRDAANVQDPAFLPKGKVSREALESLVRTLQPELEVKLKKFVPLTEEEVRFLTGLMLFKEGHQCASAVGLFHKLSKSPGWQAEADYYLAMCSRELGLETDFFERARRILESQDELYAVKIVRELGNEIPYEFTDSLGFALSKIASHPKFMAQLDSDVAGRVAYLLTEYGASTEKYKTTLDWAKKVPVNHPKKFQARFMEALAEYQVGSKDLALKLQEQLIKDTDGDKAQAEFQAMVALNLARMHFQDSRFKEAHENFMKVYKNHPMWLQSLTEFGWSQLQSGDFEGAIGNMYSIQSPFFATVYKPESYVIRTIGYMNLCQYGDAYKSLSLLEHDYRPDLDKMTKVMDTHPSYYEIVRHFIAAPGSVKEVDGLPTHVIRELARHRDFTNAQKALNRQIDERPRYAALDGAVEKSLKAAQLKVTGSRKMIESLHQKIASIAKRPDLAAHRAEWLAQIEQENVALNDHFFQIDLYNEAKAALPEYRTDVIGGADKRLASMKSEMERLLSNRLTRLKTDLARMLDNNELLRYEVFAGSGENLRYQVAGGEKSHRVPAAVLPKSKSLQWEFDGEYWEDEIGNYRSSLKNNCPETHPTKQANAGGGAQ